MHTTWFSNATTTLQWIRVDGGSDSDISSATDLTYTLVTADEGKQVKVKVDFTDDDGHDESLTSDAYPAGSTVLPVDMSGTTGVVSFSGDPTVGTALTATLSDPDNGVSGTPTWQWARSARPDTGFTDISSATGASYTPVEMDRAFFLRATATYSDGGGSGKTAPGTTALPVGITSGVFIKNTRQTASPFSNNSPRTLYQGFRTGDNPAGYLLTLVLVGFEANSGDPIEVQMYRRGPGESGFGSLVYELLPPTDIQSAGDHIVDAPPGAVLEPETDYFLRVTNLNFYTGTTSRNADGGAASGWAISGRASVPGLFVNNTLRILVRGMDLLGPPGPPGSLSATGGAGSAVLTWTAPGSTGQRPVTKYQVRHKQASDPDTAFSAWSDVADSDGDGDLADELSVSVSRPAGTEYTLEVRAVNTNGAGTGAQANVAATDLVPSNWSLIPTGLSTGDKFRLLFLSSTKRNKLSANIADYNTFVQTRAANGHADIRDYSAGFRAVGCTAAVDARDNTKTTYTTTDKGVPIYWLNGAKAADEYEDFYDGSWDDEANDKNESGTNGLDTSLNDNWPLTGCDHDGTEEFALGSSQVRVGRPNSSGSDHGPLSSDSLLGASLTRPLYGLSAVFEVAAAVVVPNNPPAFSGTTAARSVAENTAAGQNVGAALTATDADSDTLTYTLEGTDAASFDIVSGSGQIRTRTGVTYNHEAKSTHTVVVKADDGNGGTDTVTVTITVTDVDEPPGRPAAPTVSATAGSTTSLDVTWTAPTNTGPAIASYDLQYRAGTSGNFTNGPQNVTGTSAAIGSLAADTSYEVQVRATNAEGDGDWSVAGTGRTTATSAPGAPTGLSATASGTTAINLSWTAPGSTGGSAITGYKIEVSPNGTSGWTDQVANTNSTATTYAHTGLAAGDTRHYRVSAINANGAGTASNVANATTGQTTVTFGASSYTAAEGGATATVHRRGGRRHGDGGGAAERGGIGDGDDPADEDAPGRRHGGGLLGRAVERDVHGRANAAHVHGDGDRRRGQGRRRERAARVRDAAGRVRAGRPPHGDGDAGRRRCEPDRELRHGAPHHRQGARERHRVASVHFFPEHQPVRAAERQSAAAGDDPAGGDAPGRGDTGGLRGEGAADADERDVRVGESVTSFSMRAIPDGRRETGEGLRLDFGRLPAGVRKGTWGPYETIEFVDQELPRVTASFGAESYTATEGGAPARVSIHLSEPVEIEPLVVRLVVTHVGATAADYTGIPKSVRFGVGEQTQTITVKATDDTDDDDGESVTLSFVNDPNGRVRVRTGPASATVALADNDGLRRVTVSFGAVTYTATEGGADATVRVELDAAPGRSVTVPLTKAHLGNATAADYSGIPMNVTFAANQTSRTFAVMATAGDGSDGGESVSIGFGTLPEGVFAGSPAATTVTLADGGEQRLVVNFGSSRGHTVQVREGARRLRLNVLLDSSPRRPVTIPLVVTHVGGATEADYAAIPESVTFAAGQTSAHYYVRALPDEEDETGEGLRLDFGPLPPGVRKGTWGPYETIAFVDAGQTANLSVAGPVLTLDYPWALDGGSTPSPRDFVVSVEAPGGEKAMAPVAAVAVEGSDVFLQLARPVAPDDTVTLSHLADAMHPIRDEAGSPAAPLTDAPVRNQTPASGLGPEAGLRGQAANPAPLAALLEAAQVGAGTGRLDLSSRHLTDITALAGLTGLRELDLRDNAIEDLWPLAGLRGLEALYLSGNQISDLRPLAGLRGLKVLDLAGNRIEDLWPLSGLTELRELDLADNAVANLGPLAGLAGLEALDLAGNRISDVWGPGYLTRLERLNLADNAIEDLRPLARLTRLEVLLLDRNRITDVLALSPMAELANLGLAGNPIANLWPLEGLGQLHRLDLSGNAAADPSALGRVENLRWLWLDPAPAAELEAAPGPDSGPRIIVVEQRGGIFRNPLPSDADRKFEWNGGPQAY